MTYTAEERKAIHDALVACKPFLLGPDLNWHKGTRVVYEYICFALAATPNGGWPAKQMIVARLAPYISYECWIEHHHPHLLVGLTFNEMDAQYQGGRHAWVDSMIEEFSH